MLNQGNSIYKIFKNSNIIYTFIPTCPSKGFQNLTVKDNYFTIQQNTCGGWFLIDEYITFRWDTKNNQIVLYKYGYSSINRKDPNKEMPTTIYTSANFGEILFENFNSNTILEQVNSFGK